MELPKDLIDLQPTSSQGCDVTSESSYRASYSEDLLNVNFSSSSSATSSRGSPIHLQQLQSRKISATGTSTETEQPPPLPPKRRSTGGQPLIERLKNAGFNVNTQYSYSSQSSTGSSSLEGVTFEIIETQRESQHAKIMSQISAETDHSISLQSDDSFPGKLDREKTVTPSSTLAGTPTTVTPTAGLSSPGIVTFKSINASVAEDPSLAFSSTDENVLIVNDNANSKHAHFVKRDPSLSRASFRGPQIVPPMLLGRLANVDSILSVKNEFREKFEHALGKKDTDLIHENMLQFEGDISIRSVKTPKQEDLSPNYGYDTAVDRLSSSMGDLLHIDGKEKPLKNLSAEDLEQLMHNEKWKSKSNTDLRTHDDSATGDGNEEPMNARDPPPRPPEPKLLHRFSAPLGMNVNVDTKKRSQIKSEHFEDLFFGDGMFDVVEERNEEAVAFCRSVAELRKLYRFNDSKNPGYISCPRFPCNPDFLSSDQKLWKVVVYLEPHPQSREFMCNLVLKRNEVIARALSLFQGHFNALDYLSDQFVLKINGRAMYIIGNYPMIDYEYVQECLRLEKPLELSLVQTEKVNNELARTKEDDAEEFLGRYFQHFFENRTQTAVSRQGLRILLDAYNNEIAKLLAEVTDANKPRYVPDPLIQTVKAISMSLSYIETVQLQEAVQLLVSIKSKYGERKAYTLNRKEMKNFNRFVDPSTFDKGRFHLALEKLTNAVTSLVSLYCKAFDTDFNINRSASNHRSDEKSETIERIDVRGVHDKFSIRVASVHRIPHHWKLTYDYFEVECGLYYGADLLCPRLLTKLSKPCEGFFEHIRWDESLIFDMKTCDLPREARICVCLYGLISASKRTSGDTKSRNLLGWIVRNVFDFNGLLVSGGLVLGLLNVNEPNPAATCASNYIQNQGTSILKVDFEIYHSDVIFPELFVPPITARSASNLYLPEPETLLQLEQILSKDCPKSLTWEDKGILWNSRLYCRNIPKALAFVLASAPGWDAESVAETHDIVSSWEQLTPTLALELLKADYPDCTIRKFAVQWLGSITDNELCDYLPQLVQGLKFESYHDSELARFLIRKALSSPSIAHYLFWHLKYYIGDPQFCQRFQIVLGGFLSVCGTALRDQLARQDKLVAMLDQVAKRVKDSKETVRLIVLRDNLRAISSELNFCYRLPTDPSCKIREVVPEESSYFNSFTVPLSLVFQNADSRGDRIPVMFKMGDDLRKDLVTLQLFQVMNKLWLKEGVDLRMMTYHCMPTGPLTGMIEIVQNCATLREIHSQHGVTGSFKDDSISLWLQRYNASETEYNKAVHNFTASCAGCCVATYILGIGDRHNDNVMISQRGHMFHIDFSKFMGDVQKFGSIKRDRVPFVFTPDMAFVINGSETMSGNFQQFVENCCQAFNILRHNATLLLNLLGLMVSSGIPYLSEEEDLEYVRQALQLQLSDGEATSFFTRLIESSLTSKSTQLNFFIHNVAHIKDVGQALLSPHQRSLYSFTNKIYSAETDGQLVSARVVDFQKRYVPEKHYIFVINVVRKNQDQPSFVFRKFDEFQELHDRISSLFSNTQLPPFPSKILMGRSQVREVAVKRRKDLDNYVDKLTKIPIVLRSEILYTFLHSYIRDEQDTGKFSEILVMLEEGGPLSRVGGELKFSYHYEENTLNVLVMHARNLIPRSIQGYAEPYVKAYLLPDPGKSTKRKTKVIRKNLNPTFNETFSFQMPLNLLQGRVLQLSVWDHDSIRENHYLGGINVYLSTVDLSKEQTKWYKLKDLGN